MKASTVMGGYKLPCPATESHERHMASLKGMSSSAQRREYIDGVRRSEGKFYADWLQDAYGKWWEANKAKLKTEKGSTP